MPLLLLALHFLACQTVLLCSNAKPCIYLFKLLRVAPTAVSFSGMFLTSYQKSE